MLTLPNRMFGWEALAAECGGQVYERAIKFWDKRFGGVNGDSLSALAITSDDGYLLGGSSYSGIGGDKSEDSRGGSDFWIVKIDGVGTKVWDKRFGGSSHEELYALTATPDGGILVGGYSASGVGGDVSEASRGTSDYWILKTDGSGSKVWDKRFGGSSSDILVDCHVVSDGGFLLCGNSYSGVTGDKTEENRGLSDYWVVKIDGSGNKVWDKGFGGSDYDFISAVATTASNGYLLGGISYSEADGDKSETSRGGADYWVVKIDGSGNKVWDRRFGGSGEDYFTALVATSDGGHLLGGTSYSGADGDKSEASRGSSDYWIVKIDGSGNKVWDKRFGGISSDDLYALASTSDGGCILGGFSDSEVNGDKSEASRGGSDFWVVKIDVNGNKVWDKRFGGSDNEALRAIAVTDEGGYVLGGVSSSSADGDKSESLRGMYDFWIIHMDIDYDCDGIPDGLEVLADTDPTDPSSYFAVTAFQLGMNNVLMHWQGGQNVTQIIERTLSLMDPQWVPVYTNSPPTTISNLLSIGETNPVAAYRVRVAR